MGWADAKDSILLFLSAGVMSWVAYELRSLRINFVETQAEMKSQDKRIAKLEEIIREGH